MYSASCWIETAPAKSDAGCPPEGLNSTPCFKKGCLPEVFPSRSIRRLPADGRECLFSLVIAGPRSQPRSRFCDMGVFGKGYLWAPPLLSRVSCFPIKRQKVIPFSPKKNTAKTPVATAKPLAIEPLQQRANLSATSLTERGRG